MRHEFVCFHDPFGALIARGRDELRVAVAGRNRVPLLPAALQGHICQPLGRVKQAMHQPEAEVAFEISPGG